LFAVKLRSRRNPSSFGVDATPLFPEEQQKMVKGAPRETEILNLYKSLAGASPLPTR